MTSFGRATANTTGQPRPGFRSRIQSGIPISQLDSLSELVTDVGGPVWVAGATAAALHEFDGFSLKPPFHLVIPRGRHLQRVGHRIHTSVALDRIDLESQWNLPVITPTRTLIDIASSVNPAQLSAALDGAIRDGQVGESFLHRRIAALRGSGRAGVRSLLTVIEGGEISRGGHSWLEREYLRLLGESGLPRPETQVVVGRRGDRIIRVDCRFPGTPVVIELLGYRFHRTRLQMTTDAARLNQMILQGLIPFQFTYLQVVDEPTYVTTMTRAALSRAAA